LSFISPPTEAVSWKTRQDVNRDSGRNPRPKISVKNYMSSKSETVLGQIGGITLDTPKENNL